MQISPCWHKLTGSRFHYVSGDRAGLGEQCAPPLFYWNDPMPEETDATEAEAQNLQM